MRDIPVFAFPIHPDVDLSRDQIWGGMTLEDYFAAKAMQSIMKRSPATPFSSVANYAYAQAKAMMEAREA
jgi:hypothetical protein